MLQLRDLPRNMIIKTFSYRNHLGMQKAVSALLLWATSTHTQHHPVVADKLKISSMSFLLHVFFACLLPTKKSKKFARRWEWKAGAFFDSSVHSWELSARGIESAKRNLKRVTSSFTCRMHTLIFSPENHKIYDISNFFLPSELNSHHFLSITSFHEKHTA